MPEKVVPGPITPAHTLKEAVCVHSKKIFDACRDKQSSSYKYIIQLSACKFQSRHWVIPKVGKEFQPLPLGFE